MQRADVKGMAMGGRFALCLGFTHLDLVDRPVLLTISHRVVRTRLFDVLQPFTLLRGHQPYFTFNRQSNASASYDRTPNFT